MDFLYKSMKTGIQTFNNQHQALCHHFFAVLYFEELLGYLSYIHKKDRCPKTVLFYTEFSPNLSEYFDLTLELNNDFKFFIRVD